MGGGGGGQGTFHPPCHVLHENNNVANAKQVDRRKFVMSGARCLCLSVPSGPSFAHIQSVKSPRAPWSYFSV